MEDMQVGMACLYVHVLLIVQYASLSEMMNKSGGLCHHQ